MATQICNRLIRTSFVMAMPARGEIGNKTESAVELRDGCIHCSGPKSHIELYISCDLAACLIPRQTPDGDTPVPTRRHPFSQSIRPITPLSSSQLLIRLELGHSWLTALALSTHLRRLRARAQLPYTTCRSKNTTVSCDKLQMQGLQLTTSLQVDPPPDERAERSRVLERD